MIVSILRSSGAVLLSIIVAFVLVAGIEGLGAWLHPLPPDFGGTRDEMLDHVANYPSWALALLGGAGWAATMFICSWLATRLGTHRHPAHGYGVGAFLLALAILNMSMLPYPLWFLALDLLLLPAAAYAGTRLGQGGDPQQG